MKPIDGVDLSEVVREAQNDALREQRKKVYSMVRGIQDNLLLWYEERRKKESDLEKLSQKIESAQAKLVSIDKGDWSVLNENMAKASPTPETTP